MKRSQLVLAFLTAVVLAVLTITPSSAGDKKKDEGIPEVKRGPEHKILATLVGTFDAKVKLFAEPTKPVESKGVMTRKMILDGNFLQESFKGEFFGKPFAGMGIMGYDATKKKYVNTWCDNMSTSISFMQGAFDVAKKTLVGFGEEIDSASGKKMKARDVFKIVSADEQFFEMFRQPEAGPEVKVMEITYTRKAVKK